MRFVPGWIRYVTDMQLQRLVGEQGGRARRLRGGGSSGRGLHPGEPGLDHRVPVRAGRVLSWSAATLPLAPARLRITVRQTASQLRNGQKEAHQRRDKIRGLCASGWKGNVSLICENAKLSFQTSLALPFVFGSENIRIPNLEYSTDFLVQRVSRVSRCQEEEERRPSVDIYVTQPSLVEERNDASCVGTVT